MYIYYLPIHSRSDVMCDVCALLGSKGLQRSHSNRFILLKILHTQTKWSLDCCAICIFCVLFSCLRTSKTHVNLSMVLGDIHTLYAAPTQTHKLTSNAGALSVILKCVYTERTCTSLQCAYTLDTCNLTSNAGAPLLDFAFSLTAARRDSGSSSSTPAISSHMNLGLLSSCIYIYVCVCVCVYIYTCIYKSMYTYVRWIGASRSHRDRGFLPLCIYVCVCVYVLLYKYV